MLPVLSKVALITLDVDLMVKRRRSLRIGEDRGIEVVAVLGSCRETPNAQIGGWGKSSDNRSGEEEESGDTDHGGVGNI